MLSIDNVLPLKVCPAKTEKEPDLIASRSLTYDNALMDTQKSGIFRTLDAGERFLNELETTKMLQKDE